MERWTLDQNLRSLVWFLSIFEQVLRKTKNMVLLIARFFDTIKVEHKEKIGAFSIVSSQLCHYF
jgi:hypothetical protein